jgi:hypothetical protein
MAKDCHDRAVKHANKQNSYLYMASSFSLGYSGISIFSMLSLTGFGDIFDHDCCIINSCLSSNSLKFSYAVIPVPMLLDQEAAWIARTNSYHNGCNRKYNGGNPNVPLHIEGWTTVEGTSRAALQHGKYACFPIAN